MLALDLRNINWKTKDHNANFQILLYVTAETAVFRRLGLIVFFSSSLNSDIGGFLLNPEFPDALRNPAFHELYVRWMQFGCFTSMMRSHAPTPHDSCCGSPQSRPPACFVAFSESSGGEIT